MKQSDCYKKNKLNNVCKEPIKQNYTVFIGEEKQKKKNTKK